MENNRYDGIIDDLFFPDEQGGDERMNGLDIAQKALDAKIPVVIVTSTHHHSSNTQPACDWARKRNFDLIDNTYGPPKLPHKNVAGGLAALGYIIEAQRENVINIDSSGYSQGPAYGNDEGNLDAQDVMNIFNNNYLYASDKDDSAQRDLDSVCEGRSLLEKVVREYCPGILP